MSAGGSIIFVPYASPGQIMAAGIIFPILGIAAVVLRFYVRASRKQQIGMDDWLIIPALVWLSLVELL
jgi:hypothetical protein